MKIPPMYLTTISGRCLNLQDLNPHQILSQDIAHALSMLCRFAGHTKAFYSVAQHSLLVLAEVENRGIRDPQVRLQALLHDATEAYVVDLPRPIKKMLPEYQAIEAKVWEAIAARYSISSQIHPAIKQADDTLLSTEFRDLMTFQPPVSWELPEPCPAKIQPMTSGMAQACFYTSLQNLLEECRGQNISR